MVHHSKARVQALEQLILSNIIAQRAAFDISGIKRDNTVFVKFKSSPAAAKAACVLAQEFSHALLLLGVSFTRPDDHLVRLDLQQVPVQLAPEQG